MMEEVADNGGKTEVGDYLVGFAQEKAEGPHQMESGDLSWAEPPEGANCHLEVVVASAADRRFIPGASVTATFEGDDGTEVGPVDVPMLWHPGLYHYGRNLELPGDGTYIITVAVEPPSFPRHDRENGKRFGDPVEVQFEDVEMTTERG